MCLLIFAEVMFKNTFEHGAELGRFFVSHPLRLLEIIIIIRIILINNSSSSRCTFVVTNIIIIIIGIITSLMTFIENLHNLGGGQLILSSYLMVSPASHTFSLSVSLYI